MSTDLQGIVAGHNNTPIPFYDIVTDDGHYFDPPDTTGTFDEGELQQRGDDSLTLAGIAFIEAVWDIFEFQDYLIYLRDNYCDGGYSGQVTIDVSTEQDDVFSRWNCTMHIPKISEVERDRETGWYKNIRIRFLDLEFIAEVP